MRAILLGGLFVLGTAGMLLPGNAAALIPIFTHLVSDEDNFGYGGTARPPCAFYDRSEPEDVGVFDRELNGGDPVDRWTHIALGLPLPIVRVKLEVREYFTDADISTIEVDGRVLRFATGTFSRCEDPIVRTFTFTGADAAFAADGVVNVVFRENGDDVALDWSRLTIELSP